MTESYLPFTGEEVKTLFNIATYRKRFSKPDLFYSPIIALTMGLRLEELGQLYVSDIYQMNGIWVVDINDDGDDKEVKTDSSKRILPLSRHLLKTNFLEYHALVKKMGYESPLLYPYLIKTKNGYGKNIGYNFTQYKQKLITLNEEQKTFHSLRKNTGNALKLKNYDLSLRKRVLGHSMKDDVTEAVYSGDYGLEFIKHCIDSLDFDVNFSEFQFELNEQELQSLMDAKHSKLKRNATIAERQARLEKSKKKKAA